MLLQGKAHCYGDYFNTDLHLSAKYRPAGTALDELVRTMLSGLDPDFPKRVRPGDFLVTGEFFGADSSREDAVEVLKKAGIAAVISKSFAHLFFRNAINLGLLVIQADTTGIATHDALEVDVSRGIIRNLSSSKTLNFKPYDAAIYQLIQDGGLLPHIIKHGGYAIK